MYKDGVLAPCFVDWGEEVHNKGVKVIEAYPLYVRTYLIYEKILPPVCDNRKGIRIDTPAPSHFGMSPLLT